MRINRGSIKAAAKASIRASASRAGLVALVLVVIIFVLEYLSGRVSGDFDIMRDMYETIMAGGDILAAAGYADPSPVAQLLGVALNIMRIMVVCGFTIYSFKIARNIAAGMGDLFESFAIFFRVLWLTILRGIFVYLWGIPSAVALSFGLLGILWGAGWGVLGFVAAAALSILPAVAGYRYSQSFYIMLDHPELSCGACIRESKRLMQGYKWQRFVLDLSFLGWNILCVIPFVFMYVLPYETVTGANFYNALVAIDQASQPQPAPSGAAV